MWALTDQRGRYAEYHDGQIRLHKNKPNGFICGDGKVFKPRRVFVTVGPLT